MPLLLREAIGGTIRRARTERQRTLRDVSREARVSLGYLSEIERGRKEPSSELLASICEALALPLPDLLDDVAQSMRPVRAARPRPQVARPRPLTLAGGIDPALRSAVEAAFAPEQDAELDAGLDGAAGAGSAPTTSGDPGGPVSDPGTEATTEVAGGSSDGAAADPTSLRYAPDAPVDTPVGPDADAGPGADEEAGDSGDDPDDIGDTGTTPTVRLVGLVAVGGPAGPAVVYAA